MQVGHAPFPVSCSWLAGVARKRAGMEVLAFGSSDACACRGTWRKKHHPPLICGWWPSDAPLRMRYVLLLRPDEKQFPATLNKLPGGYGAGYARTGSVTHHRWCAQPLPDAHGPFGATITAVAHWVDVPGWFAAEVARHCAFAGIAEGGVSPVGGRRWRGRLLCRLVGHPSPPGRSISDDDPIEHRVENP
jgi:hypothetical protein